MACGHPGPPDSLDKPGRVSKQAGVREPGGSGGGLLLIKRGPGAGRVVEAAMSQAVAHLTEQLSGQPAQRSFVAVAGVAAALVERLWVAIALDGGYRPPAAGIGQPLVAGPAHHHHPAAPEGAGDRRGSRIGAAAGGIDKAGRVVIELAQHPGA